MAKLILKSYAKLNLFLAVLNKRKDKYHNIETLFERINLFDKIILVTRQDKKIKIICNSAGVPKGKANLAYRSAKLLQDAFGIGQGVEIRIIKNIPVASGLGGASSNAASVLLGLNKLWKLGLSKNKLAGLASSIGSDVPFFMQQCPFAQGRGRGEKIKILTALKYLRLWQVLAVPKIRVATPLVYKKWDEYSRLTPPFLKQKGSLKKERAGLTKPRHNVKILSLALRRKNYPKIRQSLFNSLEEITLRLYPQVERLKEKFYQQGAQAVLMSGSGSAVFAIISSKKEAVALRRQLENKAWQVFVARTA